jgi:hypothetical protein
MVPWWTVPIALAIGFYFALFILTALRAENAEQEERYRAYLSTSQKSSNPMAAPTVKSPVPDKLVPSSSETVKGPAK